MRILAIDYGEKRMGLAVGNTLSKTTNPIRPLLRKTLNYDMTFIKKLIHEYDIQIIVLGNPLNMNGSKSRMTQRVNQFAGKLKQAIDIPVQLIDERLSSFEAEEMLKSHQRDYRKRKSILDSVAAITILKNFMEGK